MFAQGRNILVLNVVNDNQISELSPVTQLTYRIRKLLNILPPIKLRNTPVNSISGNHSTTET